MDSQAAIDSSDARNEGRGMKSFAQAIEYALAGAAAAAARDKTP